MTTTALSLAQLSVSQVAEELESRVIALTSSEEWTAMLEFAARFHNYSFGNIMLISIQCPEASQVAGYRKWQSMGRQVQKGSKAIRIMAPMVHKNDQDESELLGFRIVNVFDISQTKGEAIPSVEDFVVHLEGDAPADWQEVVVELIEDEGFTFEWGTPGIPNANGVTRYGTKKVTILDTLSSGQAFKTSLHELAHVKLHDQDNDDYMQVCRGRREVEAESVACIVATALGLDTGDYSFGYIGLWAAEAEEGVIREAMSRVQQCARSILKGWEPDD